MRKKLICKITAVILCFVFLISSDVWVLNGVTEVYGVTQDEINDAKANAEQIEKQLAEVRQQISELKSQANNTKAYIDKFDSLISNLDLQLYELGNNITLIEENIKSTQEKLDAAQEDVKNQYNMMKLRIQFMYENNTESYFALMLKSESVGELLNKAEYISSISAYDRDMMIRYQETVSYIDKTKTELEEQYALLKDQESELDTQKAGYASLQEQRVQEMAKLNGQLTTASNLENQLSTDLSEYEDQIKKMEEEMKAQNPAISGTGIFMWPTPSTRITSDYGDTEGRTSPHKGIDIGAQKRGVSGDPIYAADSGEVTISTFSSSAGNWIWIYHGNGLYTVYMHCSSLLVKKGDTVTKGQQIARMGTTGNSTGVHLHFGVRVDGNYVNPWNYVSKP
ncbi:MAG: peptidoglycan DD-metalloendopeptidase family protein [Clostridia bacterium]|nr:peptidoglycan DD-metalloendopeptidase family protein [Clostridia bacterium]